MAQFAPVAPPDMLCSLAAHDALGNYHLLLAHDVAAQAELYNDAFHRLDPEDNEPNRYIIMDNSVIELGHPVDVDTMKAACNAIPPDVIALPDLIGWPSETIRMSTEGAEVWSKLNRPYMVVPQGQTFSELVECAEELAEIPNVKAWGIPRHATGKIGSRAPLIEACFKLRPGFDIHLLGFSDNLQDDLNCCKSLVVKGIDSAVPIRLGLHNIVLTKDLPDHPPRGDYWETANEATPLVLENLAKIRSWIK